MSNTASEVVRHEIANLQTSLMQQFQLALQHQQRLSEEAHNKSARLAEERHAQQDAIIQALQANVKADFQTMRKTNKTELEKLQATNNDVVLKIFAILKTTHPDTSSVDL